MHVNYQGVQAQVQQAEATQNPSASGADATTTNQTVAQVGSTASQAPTSQTVAATTAPGQNLNMLANTTTQTQPSVPTVVQPSAEQWYQQQQYQQYYQQYSGYDPYQQQYPYQSTAAPQYQQYMQAYGQSQPQLQSQPQPQTVTQAQPQPQQQTLTQGYSQPIPLAPVALQPQNQMLVSQQQVQPTVQQHSQGQTVGNPSVHGLPQSQNYPYLQSQSNLSQPQTQQPMQMPQYQQPHPQMPQSQPQVQQPSQNFQISQPQAQQHMQPPTPVQHVPQSQMHPQQPSLPGNYNTQPQTQNASGHGVTGHHSYPQPHAHQNMQMGAPQRPMHMHPSQGGPLPQQSLMTHPHQPHPMIPNQQQPALFPAPVRGQNIPPQQQQFHSPGQQPAQANHRPVMQAVQQPLPTQSSVHPHMPMPSRLRPQGSAPSLPEHAKTYSQQLANSALSHNPQSNQSQNAVGRPLMPNQTMLSQPFAHPANASLVRPVHTGINHLHANQSMMVGPTSKQGSLTENKSDSSGNHGKSVKDMDNMPVSDSELKIKKDMKQDDIGNVQKGDGVQPVQITDMYNSVIENGDVANKNSVKEEAAGSTFQPLVGDKSGDTASEVQNNAVNEHSGLKVEEIQDDHQLKNSSLVGTDSQHGKQQNDDWSASKHLLDAENSASVIAQTLGASQGPGEHKNVTPRGHGQSSGILGQYNQGQAPFRPGASSFPSVESAVRPHFGSRDMHGGTTNLPPHGSESYPRHRPGYLNDPHGLGSNEERFKPVSFPGQQNIGQREFEGDLKRFSAPYADTEPISKYGGHSLGPHNRGSHEFNYSSGSKLNPVGAVTSRLFPPPFSLNDVRDRPAAFHDDAIVKSDTAHRTDYLGVGSRHGLHHMDGLGIATKSSAYDFDGRDPHHFGDSFGSKFRDSRFSHLPSHFHRGEFEGPGSMRFGEHPRREFIGQDDFAGHFGRGDHLGPHSMTRHMSLGEPFGFDGRAGHVRDAELGGPQNFESYIRGTRSGHSRLGEPAFRSNFSLPGFPSDGGLLTVKC